MSQNRLSLIDCNTSDLCSVINIRQLANLDQADVQKYLPLT